TLVFAGLFIVASLMLAAVLWWESAALLERETDAVVIADTQAIGDRLRDFGLAGAVATISERVAKTADEHAIYMLTTPTLDRLAGGCRQGCRLVPDLAGARRPRLPGAGAARRTAGRFPASRRPRRRQSACAAAGDRQRAGLVGGGGADAGRGRRTAGAPCRAG